MLNSIQRFLLSVYLFGGIIWTIGGNILFCIAFYRKLREVLSISSATKNSDVSKNYNSIMFLKQFIIIRMTCANLRNLYKSFCTKFSNQECVGVSFNNFIDNSYLDYYHFFGQFKKSECWNSVAS